MSSSVLPVGAGEAAATVVAGVMTAGRRDGGAGDAVGSTGSVGGEADLRLDVAVAAVWSVKTGGGGVVVTSSDVITASTSSMVGTTQSSTVRHRISITVADDKFKAKREVATNKFSVEILKRNSIYSTN